MNMRHIAYASLRRPSWKVGQGQSYDTVLFLPPFSPRLQGAAERLLDWLFMVTAKTADVCAWSNRDY